MLNNIVQIATLVLYAAMPGEISLNPVRMTDPQLLVLGIGTTLGVVVQAMILVPWLKRAGIRLQLQWGLDARLRRRAGARGRARARGHGPACTPWPQAASSISTRQDLSAHARGERKLVSIGLLEWRKVLALKVFNQPNFQRFLVVEVPDDDRNLVHLGHLCGAPTPLAGDDLEGVLLFRMAADQERLNDPVFPDRLRQFLDQFLVDGVTGLIAPGIEALYGHQPGTLEVPGIAFGFGFFAEQGVEAAAEVLTLVFRHQAEIRRSLWMTSPARLR